MTDVESLGGERVRLHLDVRSELISYNLLIINNFINYETRTHLVTVLMNDDFPTLGKPQRMRVLKYTFIGKYLRQK